MLLTPEELEDKNKNGDLTNQSWFKDIVQQYEKQEMSPAVCCTSCLFDSDATQLVKTLHERNNEIVNDDEEEEKAEYYSLSSQVKQILKQKHMEDGNRLSSKDVEPPCT